MAEKLTSPSKWLSVLAIVWAWACLSTWPWRRKETQGLTKVRGKNHSEHTRNICPLTKPLVDSFWTELCAGWPKLTSSSIFAGYLSVGILICSLGLLRPWLTSLKTMPQSPSLKKYSALPSKSQKLATSVQVTAEALSTPWGFAKVFLRKSLHPVHEAVLRDLEQPGSRVFLRCGNEVGKTSSVAVSAILWHAKVLEGLTVSTAGAWRQIESQLVPCLKSHAHLFPGWRFNDSNIVVDGVERYVGVSAKDQGKFQGFHNKPGCPLLMIIDEGAAVPEDIYQAAEERCNPMRLLIMGAPLDPQGMFYRCATDLSRFYKQHKLSQLQCLKENGYWLNQGEIDRKIAKWGAEHPIVLSSVHADFSLAVEGALLTLREWESCLEYGPTLQQGNHRHAFLDFAAGRAKNVLAVAHGNKAWIDSAWREKNTMAAIGEFVTRLNKLKLEIGLKPEEVEGDADGMGIVFCQALAEAGWPVRQFHGGSAPRFSNGEYGNLIAEVWTEGTQAMRRREWILPNNEDLKGQLISRKTARNSKGLMMLESKEDMAKRGVESPDDADAILGAMAPIPMVASRSVIGNDPNLAQEFVDQIASGQTHNYPPGADFA